MRAVAAAFFASLLGLAAGPAGASDFGAFVGPGCPGARNYETYSKWLGTAPAWLVDFFGPQPRWEQIESTTALAVHCWADSKLKVKMIFSIPMLPSDPSATLREGATGAYDSHFARIGQIMVRNGFADATLRIGWEFNGGWYPWSANKDPAAWVAFYRKIVAAFRAVPGSNFKFDWNPNLGVEAIAPDKVYPGDDVVDYIGLDIYNQYWGPAGSIVTSPQERWRDINEKQFSLKWLRSFGAQHGKPFTVPEWGTCERPDHHGGGDDAYFVQQMAAWIKEAKPLYYNYFEFNNPEDQCRLAGGPFPKPAAAAAFKAAFGSGS